MLAALLAALHGAQGNGRVQAKGERLGEVLAVGDAEINRAHASLQELLHRTFGPIAHAKGPGVVVAAAGRDYAERAAAALAGHEAVGHLVDDAVAAEGDHAAIARGLGGEQLLCAAGAVGEEELELVVCAQALPQQLVRAACDVHAPAALRGGVGNEQRIGKDVHAASIAAGRLLAGLACMPARPFLGFKSVLIARLRAYAMA